jgi:hypothetical protein
MFDIVRIGPNHAWDENFVIRQFEPRPCFPFVFVARVRGFDKQSHGLRFQSDGKDLHAVHIMDVRAFIVAPADVQPNAIGWDIRQSVIEGFHL